MKLLIPIAISFDRGYAEQATVMLYSLLENNQASNFKIFTFCSNLDEETKQRVEKNLLQFSNFQLFWKYFDDTFTDRFYIRKGHANKFTYTRILMSDLLHDIDRFIYLDCDLLVLGDLQDLWKTNLNGKTLGAVEDPYPFNRHDYLKMPAGKKYFNAGVLIFDAKRWRNKQYTQLLIDTLIELGPHATCWDNDGLNSALYDDWEILDTKWNIQSHDILMAQENNIRRLKTYLSPTIIHFTGNLKPWNYKSSNPFKTEYYHYLKKTDFYKTHKPENKTVTNVVRKKARNVFVSLGFLKY